MGAEGLTPEHTGAERPTPASGLTGRRMKIAVIGAGNVATHLAQALAGVADVCAVVARHTSSASRLAAMIGESCAASDTLADLPADADLYLISVSDDAVRGVVEATPDFPGIWAHTSGSVPADVFRGHRSRYGVFYPLQTFTRDIPVDVGEVPMFIEGSDATVERQLIDLASLISRRVERADSRRRQTLHVAAVFACNFADLMWMEADGILREGGLDLSYLMPLMKVTLEKLGKTDPRQAMTGPARRGDRRVIERHLGMLEGRREEIYAMLSDTILREFHGPGADAEDK